MFGLLEKLQQKPETSRKKAVFVIALGIIVIIFLLWLVSLPTRLRVEETGRAKDAPSPIGTFRESIDGFVRTLEGSSFFEAEE